MSTSKEVALTLSSRKDKTVFLLLLKSGESSVFQSQRRYQGHETLAAIMSFKLCLVLAAE